MTATNCVQIFFFQVFQVNSPLKMKHILKQQLRVVMILELHNFNCFAL